MIIRAPNRQEADRYLKIAIEKYRKTAPKLSDWMEKNIPEGLEVFQVPYAYQRFLRTTNMVERQIERNQTENAPVARHACLASDFPMVSHRAQARLEPGIIQFQAGVRANG